MTVLGKTLYHCHGADKGKKFKTYESHEKAMEVHKAIMANKNKKRG